eukprot:scaffold11092_cov63-Phaeocystis_antarctica.AAC.1
MDDSVVGSDVVVTCVLAHFTQYFHEAGMDNDYSIRSHVDGYAAEQLAGVPYRAYAPLHQFHETVLSGLRRAHRKTRACSGCAVGGWSVSGVFRMRTWRPSVSREGSSMRSTH